MSEEYTATVRRGEHARALAAAREALAAANSAVARVGGWADTYRAEAEQRVGVPAGTADERIYSDPQYADALAVMGTALAAADAAIALITRLERAAEPAEPAEPDEPADGTVTVRRAEDPRHREVTMRSRTGHIALVTASEGTGLDEYLQEMADEGWTVLREDQADGDGTPGYVPGVVL